MTIRGETLYLGFSKDVNLKADKGMARTQEEITKLQERLANSHFLVKAPEHAIEKTRVQLVEQEGKLKTYEQILENMNVSE